LNERSPSVDVALASRITISSGETAVIGVDAKAAFDEDWGGASRQPSAGNLVLTLRTLLASAGGELMGAMTCAIENEYGS
jgi:hypothetical protein